LLSGVKDKQAAEVALKDAIILDDELRKNIGEQHEVQRRVSQSVQKAVGNRAEFERTDTYIVRSLNRSLETRYKEALTQSVLRSAASLEQKASQFDDWFQVTQKKNNELSRIRELIDSTWHQEWLRLTDLKAFQKFVDDLGSVRR